MSIKYNNINFCLTGDTEENWRNKNPIIHKNEPVLIDNKILIGDGEKNINTILDKCPNQVFRNPLIESYGENSLKGTSATAAGSMAFSIIGINTSDKSYLVKDATQLWELFDESQKNNESIRVSIQLVKNYDDCGTIQSMVPHSPGEINNYFVKLDNFYYEGEDDLPENSSLRVLDYPNLGIWRFGTAATALGYDTKAGGVGALAAGYQTEAHGKYSLAVGNGTKAGYAATAMGRDTNAKGRMALATGDTNTASGDLSIAGGYNSTSGSAGSIAIGHTATADGYYATSRGLETKANGEYSFALGVRTESGPRAVASGTDTKATGKNSVAVGTGSIANADNAHAEGYNALASAPASHAQGRSTVASGVGSSASGVGSHATAQAATAEGSSTTASGNHSHAGGLNSQANGDVSFAHGNGVHADGTASTAVGQLTNANGDQSFASGYDSLANAFASFAHGNVARAFGATSTALGLRTTAKGDFSFAAPYSHGATTEEDVNLPVEELFEKWIGYSDSERFNIAKGNYSIALGGNCAALGKGSAALGYGNITKEQYSVAAGNNLISKEQAQTVVGRFNDPDSNTDAVFVVGVGSNEAERKNGFWVKSDGTTSLHQIIDDKIAAAGVGGGGSSSNAVFSELNELTNLTLLNPGAYVVANDIKGNIPYSYNEETGEYSNGMIIDLVAGDLIYCEHEFYSEDLSFYYVVIRIQSINYNRFIKVKDEYGSGYTTPSDISLVSDNIYKITQPKTLINYEINSGPINLSLKDGIYTLISELDKIGFLFGDLYNADNALYLPTGTIIIANTYSVQFYTYTIYNIMTPDGNTINLQKTQENGTITYTETFNSMKENKLPEITPADEGKVLKVVDGQLQLVAGGSNGQPTESVTMVDSQTSKVYNLCVSNGKLMLSEEE